MLLLLLQQSEGGSLASEGLAPIIQAIEFASRQWFASSGDTQRIVPSASIQLIAWNPSNRRRSSSA